MRSVSAKRSRESEIPRTVYQNDPTIAAPLPEKYTIEIDAEKMDHLKVELVKVASTCDKVNSDIENSPFSPEMKEVLGNLLGIIRTIGAIQGNLLPNKPVPKPTFTNISYASVASQNLQAPAAKKPKRPETPITDEETDDDHPSENPYSKEDAKYFKFKEAVKQAEKSTLIFNLDLGKYPIMNQDTMSTRASLALSKMAAKKENLNTDIPSEAARECIDDALGMARGISFYGKQTKTYRNKTDTANSGAFCTLPVRYDFKDRNTRAKVENILRTQCDIKCATPYPLILRECMRQTVEKIKKEAPGAAVRVNVDPHNFCLKVSKKMPTDQKFELLRKHLPLPTEALDITCKTLPENFELTVDLSPTPPRKSRKESYEKNQNTSEIPPVPLQDQAQNQNQHNS